jgi:predicted membrane chloride channel (bestrophin family)
MCWLLRVRVAFAICTMRHLRFERELTQLEGKLPEAEIANIQAAKHMPLYCLERLSAHCRAARLDPREHLVTDIVHTTMDLNLTQVGLSLSL